MTSCCTNSFSDDSSSSFNEGAYYQTIKPDFDKKTEFVGTSAHKVLEAADLQLQGVSRHFLGIIKKNKKLLEDHILVIANPQGYILEVASNSSIPNFLLKKNTEYFDWSLRAIGMNAVGAAAADGNTSRISRDEHALAIFREYTSTAVPVFQENKLLAVVGYLSLERTDKGVLNNLLHLASVLEIVFEEYQTVIRLENEIEKKNALLDATKTLYSTFDVTEVLYAAINNIQTFYPEDKLELYLTQEYQVPNVTINLINMLLNENVIIEKAFIQGRLIVNKISYAKESATSPVWEIAVPLKGRQAIYGVIHLKTKEESNYSDEKVAFISNMAAIISNAFENAKLYQQSINSIKELQIINELIKHLNQSLDEQSVLNFIVNETANLVRAELVNVFRVDKENNELLIIAANDQENVGKSSPNNQGYLGLVYKTKEPVIVADVLVDEYIDDTYMKGLNYRSIICVPILLNRELIGILFVASKTPSHFTYENLKMLQHFAQHVGLTLTNAFLHSKIQHLAITDYLTGLYNRSYFDKKILELQKHERFGSLLLFDIDDFKIINDTFGHQTGDEVLVQVSKVLESSTRDNDIACRWGGEEMALYLSEIPVKLALNIAERISYKIRTTTKPQVTVSCGIAYWEFGEKAISKIELIRRADQALYKAKNSGKDQIIVHE